MAEAQQAGLTEGAGGEHGGFDEFRRLSARMRRHRLFLICVPLLGPMLIYAANAVCAAALQGVRRRVGWRSERRGARNSRRANRGTPTGGPKRAIAPEQDARGGSCHQAGRAVQLRLPQPKRRQVRQAASNWRRLEPTPHRRHKMDIRPRIDLAFDRLRHLVPESLPSRHLSAAMPRERPWPLTIEREAHRFLTLSDSASWTGSCRWSSSARSYTPSLSIACRTPCGWTWLGRCWWRKLCFVSGR